MQANILTLSRINRKLKEHNIDINPAETENPALALIMLKNENPELIEELIQQQDILSFDDLIELFLDIQFQIMQYLAEIEQRKKFAIDINVWKEDDEPKDQEKLYPNDYYLSCYKLLSSNGINPLDINIYEGLILSEEIQCQEMTKSIHEMLGIIADSNKTFCEIIKNMLKHANFTSFVLDIYTDVEKAYLEYIEKERNK